MHRQPLLLTPSTSSDPFPSLGSYCTFKRVCTVAVPHQIESRGLLKLRQYVGHEDLLCILSEAFACSWLQHLDDNCSIEYNAARGWTLRLWLIELFQAGKKIALDTQPNTTAI